MIKKNYHTHTFRSNHASGVERDYIECALENGFSMLGFSDHTPYPFDGDYYSTFRMRPELTEDYFTTCRALQEEYKDRIEIHVGLEAEYYPKYFERLIDLIRPFGCDYLILGQHFIDNEIGAAYSGGRTEEEWILARYVDQTCEALSSGYYSYFAHPDLIGYRGEESVYVRHITRLCETAKENGIPLEVNLLGLAENRMYPHEPFWHIAADVGNDVVIGCDAHAAKSFADTATWERAEAFIRKLGLNRIDDVTLRKIV